MKRILKSTLILTSDSHSDEQEECDREDSSPSGWNWVGGATYPNPLHVLS